MKNNYFEDIIHSIATIRTLLQNAYEKGFVIEGICLYTSIIDGFLRLAIVYTRTQKTSDHTYTINKKIIRQDEGEEAYLEKDIYNIALQENVISDNLYNRLLKMYKFRNKAIHRFCISGISYNQIAEKCTEFEIIYQEVFDIVAILEHGPHGIRNLSVKEEKLFRKKSMEKILGKGE